VVALLFIRRKLRLQRLLVGICLLMIWVTSTTAFANWFVAISGNWLDYIAPIKILELNVGQSDLTKKELKQNPQDQLAQGQLTKDQLTKDQLTKDQLTVDKVDPSSVSKKQIGAEENKNNGNSSDRTQ
jgi:hypothetical protein